MGRFMTWVAAAFVAGPAAGAHAEDVDCRAAPRVTAPVPGRLHGGDRVPVPSRSHAWSYVDPASKPACYVRSEFLAVPN